MRISSLLLLFTFLLSSCAVSIDTSKSQKSDIQPLTIFLVRHAEKMTDQRDPGLTKAGYVRSTHLAEMLEKVELDAVFSTKFRRTQATATSTVNSHGLELVDYDHKDLEGFAEMLKTDYQGKTILVVGHSNTTPALAGLLEGKDIYEGFDESDYGNLVVVTIPTKGLAKVVFLRY